MFDVKTVFEFSAYGSAVLFGAFKIIQNLYSFFKEFKEKKQKDTTSITVNVGDKLLSSHQSQQQQQQQIDYTALLYILSEQVKIHNAILNMHSNILKAQMDYYKRYSQNILAELSGAMNSLMDAVGIDNDLDYCVTYRANFYNFIESTENKVEAQFRHMCKDNHFADYNDKEFRELIDRHIKIFDKLIQDLLLTRFIQRQFIKNFDEVMCPKYPLIIEALKDCLTYARDVSIKEKNRVEQAKLTFEKKVEDLVGQKFTLTI